MSREQTRVDQPVAAALAASPIGLHPTASGMPSVAAAPDIARIARMYMLEARYEFLKLLRQPHYSVPTLAFPVMFYLLFGVTVASNRGAGGVEAGKYLLAGYAIFGMVTAALFAFGVGVAHERAQGWLLLKRTTPMPTSVYLASKVAGSMLFGALIVLLLALCAETIGGLRVPLVNWLALLAVVLLGCVPFCLAGLIMALIVPPVGAPGVVNLVNLPLAFASGLWMPVTLLPRMFQVLAPFLPQYHVAQLATMAIGVAPAGAAMHHVTVLLAFSIVFAIVASLAWRRSDPTVG